jgi:hypothetical protein
MNYLKKTTIYLKSNILLFIVLLCITVIVVFTVSNIFFNEKLQEIKSNKKSFLKEDEIISPDNSNNSSNISVKDRINYNSFQILYYVNNLFLDWKNIFDYFLYNTNLYAVHENENSESKNIITNIKKLKTEFSKGNVEELAKEYGELIRKECNIYKMDWRIILAIIRQESYFNPVAVSRAGAFGLMQLMPRTGNSLQNLLQLEDTKTPQNNLIAGIYYFATLVADFQFVGEDRYCFALSAYNAGLGRTIDVMTIANYFGDDYKKWENVKENLKYLSSKYDSLHSLVWSQSKKPSYGYLENWKEPYNYVDGVMKFYDEYKKMFESNLIEEKKKDNSKSKKKKNNKKSK